MADATVTHAAHVASVTTASGAYDVVLHSAERIDDDTTGGAVAAGRTAPRAARRAVLGAAALAAFAPRAHADADPRTDVAAHADYVEKEAQNQGFRTLRVKILAVEPGPTAATGCMRSRDADVLEFVLVPRPSLHRVDGMHSTPPAHRRRRARRRITSLASRTAACSIDGVASRRCWAAARL